MVDYLDIEDRNKDYQYVHSQTVRAEIGIRAIGLVYHDHSPDVDSFDNVFRLKDNIEYRLFSASHQYLILLRELGLAEKSLQDLYKRNIGYLDSNTFPTGNPYFDQVETELSSIFDSIIFHLSSVFDYLSHSICYMFFENKQETLYWTRLVKKVRSDFKDKFGFCEVFNEVDKRFVGRLYDYRSRLLHNKRDRHKFNTRIYLEQELAFDLKISCSDVSLKHFSLINSDNPENKTITLAYMASWLLKRSFKEIENILDAIKIDLEKNSNFLNVQKKGLMPLIVNQETHFAEPSSNIFWQEYKGKAEKQATPAKDV